MSTEPDFTGPATFDSLIEVALDLCYFHPEDGEPPAIPLIHAPGTIPVGVIVGPNAGGKSFMRRILSSLCRRHKTEFIGISMEFRTSNGNVARAFVFGDESWSATGDISAHTVLTGIRTCTNRTTPHVIFWDEPDIGLSEGYSRSVGRTIAAFAQNLPKHTVGAFVVSHSKPLLREMVSVNPHYFHLGSEDAPPTLQEWLDTEAPVLPLESLAEAAHARFKRIQKILNEGGRE